MTATDYLLFDKLEPAKVEEDTSTGITYIGYNNGNSDEAEACWSIKRVQEVVIGTVTTTTILFAKVDGIRMFDAIRNDRATYTYL